MLVGLMFALKPIFGELSFYDLHIDLLEHFFCSNFIFFLTPIFPFKRNYKANRYFRHVDKKVNTNKS